VTAPPSLLVAPERSPEPQAPPVSPAAERTEEPDAASTPPIPEGSQGAPADALAASAEVAPRVALDAAPEGPEGKLAPSAQADLPPAKAAGPETDRQLGLMLFDAEEHLARGAPEKAVVAASRAVRERPESLTARALLDRARRTLLSGRRLQKLESRVAEAEALLSRGDLAGADRIVTSALKLIPTHPLALALYGTLRERRYARGTAEAEAERELEQLARSRARQSLDSARSALAKGWEPRAVHILRRALRLAPDEPELLAMLGEIEQSVEQRSRERARRRVLSAQVRDGLELLADGRLEESRATIEAVLREDPEHERAQRAIDEVRAAWLRRASPRAAAVQDALPSPRPVVPAARPGLSGSIPEAGSAPARREPPPAWQAPQPVTPAAARPRPPIRKPLTAPSERSGAGVVAPEVMLPRTMRRATPFVFVVAGAAVVIGVMSVWLLAPPKPPAPRPTPESTIAPPTPKPTEPPGPLTPLDPALRQAIESAIALYAKALESADVGLLAQARPDLAPSEREVRLAPFRGALNAATDIRVIDVTASPMSVVVQILRTDVIVGGSSQPQPPTEETLRFERRGGTWALR
jgi:tetratricopeptide (TPR) repeat protein